MVSVPSPVPHAVPGMLVRSAKPTFGNRTPNQITMRGPCRDPQLRIAICGTPLSNAPLSAVQAQSNFGEEESSPGPDLTKDSSQTTPTLHVTRTPTAAIPNRRSVTWEGRTGWEDRYIDHIDKAREIKLSGTVFYTHATHTQTHAHTT